MKPTPKDQFVQIVAATRKTVPGGQFTEPDREGLNRRARNLGLDPVVRDEVLAARPRHPITRGIE
jgi:hypothetical protein